MSFDENPHRKAYVIISRSETAPRGSPSGQGNFGCLTMVYACLPNRSRQLHGQHDLAEYNFTVPFEIGGVIKDI